VLLENIRLAQISHFGSRWGTARGDFVKPRASGYFNSGPAFPVTTLDVDLTHPSAAKEAHTNKKRLLTPIARS
jgi:hypothetical protein